MLAGSDTKNPTKTVANMEEYNNQGTTYLATAIASPASSQNIPRPRPNSKNSRPRPFIPPSERTGGPSLNDLPLAKPNHRPPLLQHEPHAVIPHRTKTPTQPTRHSSSNNPPRMNASRNRNPKSHHRHTNHTHPERVRKTQT